MTYKPTEWVNAVYDDEGNILRKGTPLMAENMNNIENKLVQLDEDNHVHINKEVLDTITQSLLDMIHEHLNKAILDQITQEHLDNSHNHKNKELIDTIASENVHKHSNKAVLDKVTQNLLDNEHIHRNKEILDKITQKHLDDIGEHSLLLSDHEERIVNLVQSLSNLKIRVVSNIAERDLLENKDSIVHVIDASADTTVDSGWAQYIYQDGVWVKIAEKESLDVILNWADIEGKPTEFNPKAHSHTIADIQNLQDTLDSKETPAGSQAKVDIIKELLNTHSKNNTHITDTERTNWNSAVTEKHNHSNKLTLDKVDQDLIDKKHSHSNKLVLDKVTQGHLDNIAEALTRIKTLEDGSTQLHTHANKGVLDKLTQGHLDDRHSHENKLILDKVTQGVIDNSHSHLNKEVLDSITQALLDKIHEHKNKGTLDKITYTGVKDTIDLVSLDELEKHTHDYSEIKNTPSIPSKISDLTDDSEFVKSNAGRITVSATAPTNPQTNDIWIVI